MSGDLSKDPDALRAIQLLKERGYTGEAVERAMVEMQRQGEPYALIAPFGTVRRCPLCGCLVAGDHLCRGGV